MKETYKMWILLHRNFPKVERFGIGRKIEHKFLNIIELTFKLSYSKIDQKVFILEQTLSEFDILKFFFQFAWENKLISTIKYSDLIANLEEIGRQLGGWKKGLQKKTSAS